MKIEVTVSERSGGDVHIAVHIPSGTTASAGQEIVPDRLPADHPFKWMENEAPSAPACQVAVTSPGDKK